MSAPMHTPGPWDVVNLSGFGGPYSIRMAYSGEKTFYGVRQIHRKEDARLIAAAPELASEGEKALAAIDDLIFALTFERVDDKHPNTIGRAKEVAASLLAAIAKARGAA